MSVAWVAGGTSNLAAKISYSSDGMTWTDSLNASSIFGGYVLGMAHNGILWVAGGSTSNVPGAVTLGYSYDANTWVKSPSGNSILTTIVNGVAFGNGKFVAVGSGPSYSIAYSTDGINWTGSAINSFFGAGSSATCVAFSNNTWVAGGTTPETVSLIAYSTNGINWTLASSSAFTSGVTGIAYNLGTWTAVGYGGTQVAYSTNLSTWTAATGNPTFGLLGRGIATDGSKFIACGQTNKPLFTSTDGINWTTISSLAFTTYKFSISWNNNKWILCQGYTGSTAKCILYSSDGVTWTNATNDPIGSDGTSSARVVAYAVPVYVPCFLQGSKILHYDPIANKESYVPVETLRKGVLVKTFMSGYKPVSHIGFKQLNNPAKNPDVRDRLYGLSANHVNRDSEFDEPLYLTGRHCVLRNDLIESDLDLLKKYTGDIYVTENHYRVPIFLDQRAIPHTDNEPVTIWHFALEHSDIQQNYGVMANGILVESSSAEFMSEHSNMELVD